MHLQHKICQQLISLKEGTYKYTSLRYRDDKYRRALGLLRKEGYFIQLGLFTYQRTDKK